MKKQLTEAEVIEYFHLVFLQVLSTRLDQSHYVLKGGVNLRYFFGSYRYSEDIDLDAIRIERWSLETRVDKVLDSPAMQMLLRSEGLAFERVTKPKQTETTQRWKLLITTNGRKKTVHTKIEFSHRADDPRRILEPVPDQVVAPYALRPPAVLHYTEGAAIEQKIGALALRSETQARDLFDLELLMRRYPDAIRPGQVTAKTLQVAIERATELPFAAFRDQVMPFLDREVADLYRPDVWDQMQSFVIDRLMELR
ncbi:MAG: nucleotidyl transferase AbiEii/AbiGii toxin family protein [Actinobacteria bacterium]|nr:nucleotidyl transferase AbiEii/AbiGii toxin family protein [Actinomycetota bacterium]MBU1944805.1 nucleotidyl transferase AbiEii/AbiGii toxin family protein [Actinomycetota bacterium]MBU2687128.1 nucleotidyl transferase AbiEii/AbiGii toxin family protein [Actinomycetota bacterium]